MFVENLSYVVVEGVGEKRNFEREGCVVKVGILFWLIFVLSNTNRNLLTLRVEIDAVLTDVSVLCTINSVTELTEQTDPHLRLTIPSCL